VIGIFDNGSVDGTSAFCASLPEVYGVEWRVERSDVDRGCAYGTNMACKLVSDCEYSIHLESDFIHLSEAETGIGKLWLNEAIELMDSGECDYLYLRRMRYAKEMMMHWWSQWMPKVTESRGSFLRCPEFWWSNNPHLRRNSALYECGTLPLNEGVDGVKGTVGWSKPELLAKKPPNTWIHQWGMFTHEGRDNEFTVNLGCGIGDFGMSLCKYGFYESVGGEWCRFCDFTKGFEDLHEHEQRYRRGV